MWWPQLRILLLACIFSEYQVKWIFVRASDDEYRLLQDLRSEYDPVERPVQDHTKPVNVHLRILLQQLVDVMTSTNLFEPACSNGSLLSNEVSIDSMLLEKVGEKGLSINADENFDARFPVNFVVQHTGDILQAPPAIVKSSCKIDITWFPFDEQICHLKYGSWTYTGNKLDLFIDDKDLDGDNQMDLSYYVQNGEWELIATPARRISSTFGNESYVELYFYLHIQRKTIYYGMNWIIPSILFLLSNVLGFTMPSECGEKITLRDTTHIHFCAYHWYSLFSSQPHLLYISTDKNSAAFFSISMIILGSSIIFTLLIINVHFRSPRTHKMSPWVRTAFLEWLPWLLLMNRPGKQFKKPKKQSTTTRSCDTYSLSRRERSTLKRREKGALSRQSDSEASRMGRVDSVNSTIFGPTKIGQRQFAMDPEKQTLLMEATAAVRQQRIDEKLENTQFCSDAPTVELLRNTLNELSDYLQLSQTKMDEEEEEEEAKADWRFMAMALDRACLFFYAFLSAILPVWFWGAYKT